MIDKVPSRDLIDGASTIFPKAIRLRFTAVEVLGRGIHQREIRRSVGYDFYIDQRKTLAILRVRTFPGIEHTGLAVKNRRETRIDHGSHWLRQDIRREHIRSAMRQSDSRQHR